MLFITSLDNKLKFFGHVTGISEDEDGEWCHYVSQRGGYTSEVISWLVTVVCPD